MKFCKISAISFLFILFSISPCFATIEHAEIVEDANRLDRQDHKTIKVTGFNDYPPLGYAIPQTGYDDYKSVFDEFMAQYYKRNTIRRELDVWKEYIDEVRDVRSGKIDLIMGMYGETDIYNGIEYIYPAAFINHIYAVMMPEKMDEISQVNDFKKLKGAMSSHEHVSDYVARQLKEFDIEVIESSYEIYEKLFTGQIDFVFSSKYFAIIELSKLGLQDRVSFSTKPLWSMPVFFGVSKTSEHRNYLRISLSESFKDPTVQEQIKNSLIKMINDIEEENRGIVPPTFSIMQD